MTLASSSAPAARRRGPGAARAFEADVVAARERAARSASDERLRITRELHDVIGHAMSVMVVQAGVAEQLLDTDPDQARTAIAQIGETGRSRWPRCAQLLGALRDGDGRPTRSPGPRCRRSATCPPSWTRSARAGLAGRP